MIGSNGHLNGHLSGTGGIPPSTQSDLEKIRDLEFRFHMSLLQEGAACALGQNIGKTLSSRGSSSSSNTIAARVKMNVAGVMNHPSGGLSHGVNGAANGATAGSSFPIIFPSPHASVSFIGIVGYFVYYDTFLHVSFCCSLIFYPSLYVGFKCL